MMMMMMSRPFYHHRRRRSVLSAVMVVLLISWTSHCPNSSSNSSGATTIIGAQAFSADAHPITRSLSKMWSPRQGGAMPTPTLAPTTGTTSSSSSSSSTCSSSSTTKLHGTPATLAQYAPAVANLFGSMIVPTTVLAGAMMPMAFTGGISFLPSKAEAATEANVTKLLRKLFPLISILTFASLLLSVVWASVARNRLTESDIRLATSVWDLLSTDLALEWTAVNCHFVVGLIGFMTTTAVKLFFLAGKGKAGAAAAGVAGSASLLVLAVINRGVEIGGGGGVGGSSIEATCAPVRYGGNVIALLTRFVTLFWKRALSWSTFGWLEMMGSFGIAFFVAMFLGQVLADWKQE